MPRNWQKETRESMSVAAAAAAHLKTVAPPLAVALAEAAVHGGVAGQVVRLLTGMGLAEAVDVVEHQRPGAVQEKRWDATEAGPESSAPIKIESEEDGELTRLLKMVRARRTTQQQKRKRAS